jgi:hypothetical protein
MGTKRYECVRGEQRDTQRVLAAFRNFENAPKTTGIFYLENVLKFFREIKDKGVPEHAMKTRGAGGRAPFILRP